MTAICSGGPSGVQPGKTTAIYVDQAYIQSILPSGLAWAYPYLPFMHGLEIGDPASFCAVDPPTWTVPTASQIMDFLTGGDYFNVNLVNNFLQDVTRAYLWYGLCQCTTVATPAPPAAPTAPAGAPLVNPAGTVLSQQTACLTINLDAHLLSITDPLYVNYVSAFTPLPAGCTSVTAVGSYNPTDTFYPTAPHYCTADIYWFNAAGTNLSHSQMIGIAPGDQTSTATPPVGATQFQTILWNRGQLVPADIQCQLRFFCGTPGATGTGYNPCVACPPDPILMARLNQLSVTMDLIQRQLSPFAYVSGAAHHSLTGSGTLSVQGILGALLNVSGLSDYGVDYGTPDTYFDVGTLRFGTPDGYGSEIRIDTDSQVVLPPAAGLFTVIAYDLNPGVTMTLTELVREP